MSRIFPWSAAAAVIAASSAAAQSVTTSAAPASSAPAAAAAAADSAADLNTLPAIVVTAQHLDESRSHIQTQTGASTYTIDAAAVAATPGGDNTLLNQVIMQAPEVAQDSFGQFHVRGEHNGLQYRLNGIILPEGISVFGQSLDPRLISSMSLITGALPAEYGLRTAGIIDLTTKSGIQRSGRRGVSCMAAATAGAAELQLRRRRRGFQLLRVGRFSAQRSRHRVAGRQLQSRSTITPPSIMASAISRTSSTRRIASR